MKILHTTDLHFNQKWFQWIAQQQDEFDIFCVSGDLLESSKDELLLEQIAWITNWIIEFKKPLFVCSGNHDIEEFDNEDWLNKIDTSHYFPDNYKATINGVEFGCFPYLGAEGYYDYDECDVLITHVPPTNTKTSIDKNGNDWGDKELYRAIKNGLVNPKIILCGHLHSPIKTIDNLGSTTIYNTGANKKSKTPNHHIIDI